MKNHYIPRFITKPWELPNRDLNYLDLKRNEFKTRSSDLLLRKRNLFTRKLDDFFNHKIEDILGKSLPELLKGDAVLSNWKVYRALMLFILFQGGRSSAFHTGKRDLERLLRFTDQQLDDLVRATEQQWKLGSLQAHSQAPLHYPDTGIFPILIPVPPDHLQWIFAVPIHPTRAVVQIPNELTLDLIGPSVLDGRLTTWSVGSSAFCRKIVVHPSYLQAHPKREIQEELLRQRQYVDHQIRMAEQRNALINQRTKILEQIFNPKN